MDKRTSDCRLYDVGNVTGNVPSSISICYVKQKEGAKSDEKEGDKLIKPVVAKTEGALKAAGKEGGEVVAAGVEAGAEAAHKGAKAAA